METPFRQQVVRAQRARALLVGGLLAAVFAAGGFLAQRQFPAALLVGLLKYAVSLVGIAWLFSLTVYNKLSDATDMPGLDYHQHRNLEIEVQARLRWFWVKAFALALMALAMSLPALLEDTTKAGGVLPPWAFALAFGALGLALFSLQRLWSDMEEIRELRSRVKELERREKERAERVKALKDDVKGGWPADERLDGFRSPGSEASEPPPSRD